jgi:hypothetical protein
MRSSIGEYTRGTDDSDDSSVDQEDCRAVAQRQAPNRLYVSRKSHDGIIDAWIPGIGGFIMTLGKNQNVEGIRDRGSGNPIGCIGYYHLWIILISPKTTVETSSSTQY